MGMALMNSQVCLVQYAQHKQAAGERGVIPGVLKWPIIPQCKLIKNKISNPWMISVLNINHVTPVSSYNITNIENHQNHKNIMKVDTKSCINKTLLSLISTLSCVWTLCSFFYDPITKKKSSIV